MESEGPELRHWLGSRISEHGIEEEEEEVEEETGDSSRQG